MNRREFLGLAAAAPFVAPAAIKSFGEPVPKVTLIEAWSRSGSNWVMTWRSSSGDVFKSCLSEKLPFVFFDEIETSPSKSSRRILPSKPESARG